MQVKVKCNVFLPSRFISNRPWNFISWKTWHHYSWAINLKTQSNVGFRKLWKNVNWSCLKSKPHSFHNDWGTVTCQTTVPSRPVNVSVGREKQMPKFLITLPFFRKLHHTPGHCCKHERGAPASRSRTISAPWDIRPRSVPARKRRGSSPVRVCTLLCGP